MTDSKAPEAETDDAFEQYVAFKSSRGARWEENTGIYGSLLTIPGLPVAALCYWFGAPGSVSLPCYAVAGVGVSLFVIYLFLYFYRRNAWW